MVKNKFKKSATGGTKPEGSVGLDLEALFKKDPFELSVKVYEFIWEHDRFVNDETLRFVRDAFKGFTSEVQGMMVDCLREYFAGVGYEGDQYLPLLGVEHIDLLMNQIAYKIDHGQNKYR